MFGKRSRLFLATVLVGMLALAVTLVGCGGGGGLSVGGGGGGGVGKSPINGASVYARLANGTWTAKIGETNAQGAISFTNISLIPSADYPVIVKATGGKLKNGNNFTGELRGVLKSATSNVYISPASTVVAAMVDSGKSVSDAENEVRAIVQNQLGYTGVDPLGNFLASDTATGQNEVAQQALLFVLGIDDIETNSSSMNNLLSTLEGVGSALASGSKTFDTIAGENSGYTAGTAGGLAKFVSDNSATIEQIASDALPGVTYSTPTQNDSTVYPDRFVVNVSATAPAYAAPNRAAATESSDTSSSYNMDLHSGTTVYITIGLTASTGDWTYGTSTVGNSTYTLSALPAVGNLVYAQDSSAIPANLQFTAATAAGTDGKAQAVVLKYSLSADVAAQTVTFTFTADGVSGGATVTRTVTVDLIDASASITAQNITWQGGTNIFPMVGTVSGPTVPTAATYSLPANALKASVSVLGGTWAGTTDFNNKYMVRFIAPDGVKFNVGSTLWSNYDVPSTDIVNAGSTASDTNFTGAVATATELKTSASKPFGEYTFTARLIKKSDSSIERSAGDSIHLVTNGAQDWPAKIDSVQYNDGTGWKNTESVPMGSATEIQLTGTRNFRGRVLTWEDIANSTQAGPSSMAGNWYLIAGPAPSSGTYGLGASSTAETANLDATTYASASYSQGGPPSYVTGSLTNLYFAPNYGTGKTNQDNITLQYVDTTNDINISSNGGITINSTP